MSVGYTIPMARALLADGRAPEVARMLEPLLERSADRSAPVSRRDEVTLRSLLARILLLEQGDVNGARLVLRPVLDPTTLHEAGPAARAEVELWAGWRDLLADAADARRGAAAARLSIAAELSANGAAPETVLWCNIGRAQIAAERGFNELGVYLSEAARRLQRSIGSAQADPWLQRLPFGDHRSSGELPDHVWSGGLMDDVAVRARLVAPTTAAVFISGERGTGRRHLARAIHVLSGRPSASFRPILCSGRVDSEIDEEIRRMIESDSRPTLCLHDVDELPTTLQRRAAAAEAEGEVRLICTASRDFLAIVDGGRLDPTLKEALGLLQLQLPPLRRRAEDVDLLVRHFLRTMRSANGLPAAVTEEAMALLRRYAWPGNIRQLRNEIERALVHVQSEPAPVIRASVLSPDVRGPGKNGEATAAEAGDLDRILAQTEKAFIESVLSQTGGQVSACAEVLGLSRQGLYKKMKRLDVDPAKYQNGHESVDVRANV